MRQAEGKAKAALGELEVAKNKAETDIAKAELDLTLAQLDKKKYLDGDFKVEFNEKTGWTGHRQKSSHDEAVDKLENYRKLGKRALHVTRECCISRKPKSPPRNTPSIAMLQN